MGAEVTFHHSTHNLLQIGDCLSLLPHLACRHKTGMGKEKRKKKSNTEKNFQLSHHGAEKAWMLSVQILVWLEACVCTTFISSPPPLSLALSLTHTHTFPCSRLPGTPHFLPTASSLSDTKKEKRKKKKESTGVRLSLAALLWCQPVAVTRATACSLAVRRPSAVTAGDGAAPRLGRIKLTRFLQHSLQGRWIAVQTHPKFLSLPVSLRILH